MVDYGAEAVNQCLDAAYALERFVDPKSNFGPAALEYRQFNQARFKTDQAARRAMMVRDYPYADLDSQAESQEREAKLLRAKTALKQERTPFPSQLEQDLLLF